MSRRYTLTRAQTPIVLDLLKAHCHKDPSGRAVYDDTWDDQRVLIEAEALNPDKGKPLLLSSIEAWRRDIYGRIRTPRAYTEGKRANAIAELKAEIGDLKFRLQLQSEMLEAHETKIAKMELHLRHRGGYVPPPGKQVSTPPSNGPANG